MPLSENGAPILNTGPYCLYASAMTLEMSPRRRWRFANSHFRLAVGIGLECETYDRAGRALLSSMAAPMPGQKGHLADQFDAFARILKLLLKLLLLQEQAKCVAGSNQADEDDIPRICNFVVEDDSDNPRLCHLSGDATGCGIDTATRHLAVQRPETADVVVEDVISDESIQHGFDHECGSTCGIFFQ